MVKKKVNNCPKAKRCKYGADCINFDTFKGEYLCFEAKTMSQYIRPKKGGEKHDNRRKEKSSD